MSESLEVEGSLGPEYVVGTLNCLACQEVERHRASRARGDEQDRKNGVNPDAWRLDRVDTRAEALANPNAQQRG